MLTVSGYKPKVMVMHVHSGIVMGCNMQRHVSECHIAQCLQHQTLLVAHLFTATTAVHSAPKIHHMMYHQHVNMYTVYFRSFRMCTLSIVGQLSHTPYWTEKLIMHDHTNNPARSARLCNKHHLNLNRRDVCKPLMSLHSWTLEGAF